MLCRAWQGLAVQGIYGKVERIMVQYGDAELGEASNLRHGEIWRCDAGQNRVWRSDARYGKEFMARRGNAGSGRARYGKDCKAWKIK